MECKRCEQDFVRASNRQIRCSDCRLDHRNETERAARWFSRPEPAPAPLKDWADLTTGGTRRSKAGGSR